MARREFEVQVDSSDDEKGETEKADADVAPTNGVEAEELRGNPTSGEEGEGSVAGDGREGGQQDNEEEPTTPEAVPTPTQTRINPMSLTDGSSGSVSSPPIPACRKSTFPTSVSKSAASSSKFDLASTKKQFDSIASKSVGKRQPAPTSGNANPPKSHPTDAPPLKPEQPSEETSSYLADPEGNGNGGTGGSVVKEADQSPGQKHPKQEKGQKNGTQEAHAKIELLGSSQEHEDEYGELGSVYKGMRNPLGHNNCFINVVVQSLWLLNAFRSRFDRDAEVKNHRCTDQKLRDKCMLCALKVLF